MDELGCNECDTIFNGVGSCSTNYPGVMCILFNRHDEPHLEFPNQGEEEVPGEVESLVGEEDLLGVLASHWLASVGNH